MKFDMFNEVQSVKPWRADHERRTYHEIIEQARAADRYGYEIWWQVEHNATPRSRAALDAMRDLLDGEHTAKRLTPRLLNPTR